MSVSGWTSGTAGAHRRLPSRWMPKYLPSVWYARAVQMYRIRSGLRHKQMRYEGIIDMHSDVVYWNG